MSRAVGRHARPSDAERHAAPATAVSRPSVRRAGSPTRWRRRPVQASRRSWCCWRCGRSRPGSAWSTPRSCRRSPTSLVDAGGDLAVGGSCWSTPQASLARSLSGFGLAVAVAVPLGLLIGWYRPVADAAQPAAGAVPQHRGAGAAAGVRAAARHRRDVEDRHRVLRLHLADPAQHDQRGAHRRPDCCSSLARSMGLSAVPAVPEGDPARRGADDLHRHPAGRGGARSSCSSPPRWSAPRPGSAT